MVRTIRLLFGMFKVFSMFYTVWRGSRTTRAFWLIGMIWRILRRRPGIRKPPRLMFTMVGPRSEQIYRRRGWRRVGHKTEDS